MSRRLWVGGLGHWTTSDMLANEFDRYGLIEKLEYEVTTNLAVVNKYLIGRRRVCLHPLLGYQRCTRCLSRDEAFSSWRKGSLHTGRLCQVRAFPRSLHKMWFLEMIQRSLCQMLFLGSVVLRSLLLVVLEHRPALRNQL